MSELHLRRIRSFLLKNFDGLIDMSDYVKKSDEEQEAKLLSRAVAANAVQYFAGIDFTRAAEAVTDLYDDNGLDAIYYDQGEDRLYIVQSKWHKAGKGSFDLSSANKFVAGVRDLINTRYDRFNLKVKEKKEEIQAALDNSQVKIIMICAHTGTDSLSKHVIRPIDDLLQTMNDISEVLLFEHLDQSRIHKFIFEQASGSTIELEIALKEWGIIHNPYQAFYGHVAIGDVAGWYSEHGSKLVEKNLRKFVQASEVNESIQKTLNSKPENFWYFNNGITMLCDSVAKKPIGGDGNEMAILDCKGVSVVNGAQTVGSIGSVVKAGSGDILDASVLVRIISLENCPENFGYEVTKATNMQNRVEPRDFAALDPQQERLRRELFLEYEKIYAYKTGDILQGEEEGFTIDEATIALACHHSLELAVRAKSYISGLYEDITRHPYTSLFNEKLTAFKMWRLVEALRVVEKFIRTELPKLEGRNRQILVHGNRFLQHLSMQQIEDRLLLDQNSNPDTLKSSVKENAAQLGGTLLKAVEDKFSDAYPASLFKNLQRCRELREFIGTLEPLTITDQVPNLKVGSMETPLFGGLETHQ